MRVIFDLPTDGPTNMARDEALLMLVGQGVSLPTLRFYRWESPTISLGYFQKYADYAELPTPASELAVVRRQTGGGAILHDRELTYSIVLPLSHPLVAYGRCNYLYEHVHAAFAAILMRHGVPVQRGVIHNNGVTRDNGAASHRGPFFCFERHSRYDLLAGGKKLLGSAQRRTAEAVLQHGSLVLDCRYEQWTCATVAHYAPTFNIDDHLPMLARAIFGNTSTCESDMSKGSTWTQAELDMAATLRNKYASTEWTRAR